MACVRDFSCDFTSAKSLFKLPLLSLVVLLLSELGCLLLEFEELDFPFDLCFALSLSELDLCELPLLAFGFGLASNSEGCFLAHLWCAYAIPLALSVVHRPSSVVCVVSSNLTTADMKEII